MGIILKKKVQILFTPPKIKLYFFLTLGVCPFPPPPPPMEEFEGYDLLNAYKNATK